MVEFRNVTKVYANGHKALDNVSLSIDKGEFVFVVGASGAGKSTFLKLIMREEVPTSGSVNINGYELNTMKRKDIPYFRRTMGIVFQDFRLIPNMEVYDNVAFALRVTGARERDIRKRVCYALSMVGLSSKIHSMPQELSGGEQQRVAIARALVNKADLIIADEPTGNIDPAMSVEIMELLNHINATHGTTIVMVTHAHDLVKQYDHRVVVLRDGELVADSTDKDAVIPFLNENEHTEEAGYYEPPNEFEDVEAFIRNYGKSSTRPSEDFYSPVDREPDGSVDGESEPGENKDSSDKNAAAAEAEQDNTVRDTDAASAPENETEAKPGE